MTLNVSKPADAKAANVEGEGGGAATFNVVDADGKWYRAKGQYPIIDPEGGARFEAGVPTRAIYTSWIQHQIDAGGMEEVDPPADAKGKAARTPDPALDERPPETSPDATGSGMKSGVEGS